MRKALGFIRLVLLAGCSQGPHNGGGGSGSGPQADNEASQDVAAPGITP